MFDETCGADDFHWSIVASASTNSTLAGVLAGFLFTGIVMLFGRPSPEIEDSQTISLFSAALLALGLDSYLFSLITGSRPETGDGEVVTEACMRVWTQGMPASGMLAVGGTALVGGIGWLLSSHVTISSATADKNLRFLGGLMTIATITTTTLLLVATTLDYLDVMFDGRPHLTVVIFVIVVGLTLTTTSAGVAIRRTKQMVDSIPTDNVALPLKSMRWATRGIIGFAIFGPVFAGILTRTAVSSNSLVVGLALLSGIVVPGLISLAVTFSVPNQTRTSVRSRCSVD